MRTFFDDGLFLSGDGAKRIYASVLDLPIIDYHCHLDPNMIKADCGFLDLGEMWLAADHYKWRAMRLCGVDEEFITGSAEYKEKFFKYAEIMPRLIGNPLYYWSHLELKTVFGITEPLNKDSAARIYAAANEKLKDVTVLGLLKKFNVEYVATTDDPVDSLTSHGRFGSLTVAPTFRPDKLLGITDEYLGKLSAAANVDIKTLDDLKLAIVKRLDYFVAHGCKISDCGFDKFPARYASEHEAHLIFERRRSMTSEERDAMFGYLSVFLAKEYAKRGMLMQLHFSVVRNVNREMFGVCGADSGFDVIGEVQPVSRMIEFFNRVPDGERPKTVLYTLNDGNLNEIAAVTGAFKNVKLGAAWWFNDTAEGIRRNLSAIAEYSALGTNYGMLTDSRSFSSYVRFDFFRRILSDFLGRFVDGGECDLATAEIILS